MNKRLQSLHVSLKLIPLTLATTARLTPCTVGFQQTVVNQSLRLHLHSSFRPKVQTSCPPFGGHTNIASHSCRLRCVIPTFFGTSRAPRQGFGQVAKPNTLNNVKNSPLLPLTHLISHSVHFESIRNKDSSSGCPHRIPRMFAIPHQPC